MASIPRTSTYDVFLSFRGKDTRCNFTDHLYNALVRRGIRTFRDDKLRRGEEIAPELLKVIEESTYSVIVFSENYAHSRWCLDELVKIMECKKDRGNTVIPIFYHVDPSHVRKQEGSFGDAFAGYKENWKDKIPRWRMALTEAGNLSGWHLQDGYESNKIKEITDIIFRRLKCKRLDVGANLVGIDSRVKEMILWLHMESSDVRIVGIYGVGGIEIGIKNLNDKCLITLPYNRIAMHDLIQQMGWKIVREKFPDEPNKWSRLWDPCDFERALTANEGIKRVETISLDLSKSKGVCVSSNVFAKTTRLRLLKVHSGFHRDIVREEENGYYDDVIAHASKMQLDRGFKFPSFELRYLCWDGYPLDFLPSNFDGGKLVELHLHCSNIKRLWLGNKDLERLKVIDLSYSRKLIQMSEFSRMPNLESLFLNGCVSLIDIHPSVGNLKKLTTLSLRSCDKLKNLPDSIWDLESLEILDLSYYLKFEKFPGKGGNMKSLRKLHLKDTAIKDLPDSIGDLESLETLDLSDCSKFEKFPEKGGNMKSLTELSLKNTAIKDLPDSIGDLESLEILILSNCSKFEKFPMKGGNMKSLKWLNLRNTAIKDLPDSIVDLESLEYLYLSDCSKFEKFPEKGLNMKSLIHLDLKNTAIKDLPTNISRFKILRTLILGGCSDLWEGLISNLQKLNISQCKMAGQILVLPSSLEEMDAHHCTSKEDLSGLLWLCHLNWLKSTTEELKCWKLRAVIPESSGIPEWIRYQNMGSEVTTELPTNCVN